MLDIENAEVQVNCQKSKQTELKEGLWAERDQRKEYVFEETEGISGKIIFSDTFYGEEAKIKLHLKNESCRENQNLEMEYPVTVRLKIKNPPKRIMGLYLFNDWWTRPAFADDFSDIPERTQIAFLEYENYCICLVPMAGERFKAYLSSGKDNEMVLKMTAHQGGMSSLEETVYVQTKDEDPYKAVKKAFQWLAREKNILTKEERNFPEIFKYLGWCSWDAFYFDITEQKIREKANELEEKQAPIRWMLLDDGWMSEEKECLYDFVPDKEKFPTGFLGMTREIKEKGKIQWFGVWHALGGAWGGILPGSKLEREENQYLCKTVNGKVLPMPKAEQAYGFYRDWHKYLRGQGIDFVKVDGQSAVKNYYENSVSVCLGARELHQGLEAGAVYMNGAVINCMGMAMENMLARPSSAVSRNSDDFVPGNENVFAEHLLQNAYNAIYQDELYYCDWDMFWTEHKDCVKHSLLRGISGGPVYISDKINETDVDVLKPLAYRNGRILMMDRAAKPSIDCIFTNPMDTGTLKLTNVGKQGELGGIAVYNLTDKRQTYEFRAQEIWDIEKVERYWIYDYFSQKAVLAEKNKKQTGVLEAEGYAWYQILPCKGKGALLGLIDKYAGFLAVEQEIFTEKGMMGVIAEQGPIGFLCLKKPIKVFCNGVDMMGQVRQSGLVYKIPMEEKTGKVQIEIVWE